MKKSCKYSKNGSFEYLCLFCVYVLFFYCWCCCCCCCCFAAVVVVVGDGGGVEVGGYILFTSLKAISYFLFTYAIDICRCCNLNCFV